MNLMTTGPAQPVIAQSTTAQTSAIGPGVSLNLDPLTYDRPSGRHRCLFRPLSGAALAALATVGAAVVVATVALTAAIAGANEGDTEAKIKAVHLDLTGRTTEVAGPLQAQGSANPARYRSLVVESGGVELDLAPLTGVVAVTVDQDAVPSLSAELDGLRIGSAAPNFADSLADGAGSADVQRFVSQTGGSAAIDLTYPRALDSGDFLLVQELNGDSALALIALDTEGATLGTPITVGPVYQWNTGHGDGSGATAWASAVSVDGFGAGRPVSVVRVVGADVQFKVVALGSAEDASSAPQVTAPADVSQAKPAGSDEPAVEAQADTTTDADTLQDEAATEAEPGQAAFAAVGVELKVQPAIAVDGEGCATADDPSSIGTSVGQAATYCFVVTNQGTTHLTDVTITDDALGLESASLPRVAGQGPLVPGGQAVFYHQGTMVERSSAQATVATAVPSDADGGPVAGLVSNPAADLAASGQSGQDGSAIASESPAQVSSDDVPLPPAPTEAEPPAVIAQSSDAPQEAVIKPPTQLALTGMVTEPWVLVIFAMAFIFVGYTAYAAFTPQPAGPGRGDEPGSGFHPEIPPVSEEASAPAFRAESGRMFNTDGPRGHSQLDALGFD